mmetsp:Transcript_42813/g.56574  ORF Transcript_42813/g.56574 Transcript_42813/m.56574 type:complete len:87 (+) Transcript_42813:87-347(+)
MQKKILHLQKQIKKLKVTSMAKEITEEMIRKLCFAKTIGARNARLNAAAESEAEETKSEHTATTAVTATDPTETELDGLKVMRLGY